MGFWDVLSKLADVAQVFSAITGFIALSVKVFKRIPVQTRRRIARVAHDPCFVLGLAAVQTTAVIKLGSVPPFYAVLLTLIFIPVPMAITLRRLRKYQDWKQRAQSVAVMPFFSTAYYVVAIIAVCTLSLTLNQSVSNTFGYLSLPEQIW